MESSWAAERDKEVWIISCSTICEPMVMAGAKLAIGSWKIIEIAPPRTTTSSLELFNLKTSSSPTPSLRRILLFFP